MIGLWRGKHMPDERLAPAADFGRRAMLT